MDRALVEKHLAHVVDSVTQLRRLGKPDRLREDPVQMGFVIHTLQTAIQAAIDVAAIVVAERHLGEPANYRDLFAKLAGDGWIAGTDTEVWRRIVGFRNTVVHRYLDVDPMIVKAIVESHLDDLLGFARMIREKLG